MARPAPRILADAQTAILRGIFRQFAADLLAVLGEPSDAPLAPATVNALLRETDRTLGALFGRTKGDPDAVLLDLLIASDHRARLDPLTQAVTDWRDALPHQVIAAIETEAMT